MSGQYSSKKAQVLIIFLWILVVLTILAVSIGYRASMTLRFSRYQKDRLKAVYLAKAGINRAIVEVARDDLLYDALNDNWAANEEIFKKIALNSNENEFATVSYVQKEEDEEVNVYGVIDEERKININEASKDLLAVLLNDKGVIKSSEIAHNICAWRGDTGISIPDYTDLGYSNKGEDFTNAEELTLVKGIEEIDQDTYERLKDLITVWGEGKVNINTAPEEVLKALGLTAVTKLQTVPGINISEADVNALVEAIISFRERGEYFETNEIDTERIRGRLTLRPLDEDNRTKIISELISLQLLTAVSDNFKIKSTGNVNNVIKRITATYYRTDKKVVFWYES